jgi:hypothetical protein
VTSDVTGFICRCKDDGKAEADALVARVREALDNPEPHLFMSRLIMELNWEHNAYVDMIAADQWFGVSVKAHDDSFSVYFQCDLVEDGLAACYDAFVTHAKERDGSQ